MQSASTPLVRRLRLCVGGFLRRHGLEGSWSSTLILCLADPLVWIQNGHRPSTSQLLIIILSSWSASLTSTTFCGRISIIWMRRDSSSGVEEELEDINFFFSQSEVLHHSPECKSAARDCHWMCLCWWQEHSAGLHFSQCGALPGMVKRLW